jgi:hypothetical protein
MTDPPRLSTSDPNGLAATLLRSADADDPPGASRQRMLIAASVGAEAFVASSGASGAVASAGAASSFGALAIKWAAIGIATGGLTIGATQLARPSRPAGDPRAVPAATVLPKAAIPSEPAPVTQPITAPAAVESAADLAPRPSRPAAAPISLELAGQPAERDALRVATGRAEPAPLPPAGAAPDLIPAAPGRVDPASAALALADEVKALDGVREELARGKTALTLTLLDRYDRDFPSGRLAPESQLLRIEALVHAGERDAAERLARDFLVNHPTSAHGARVRSLLASLQKNARP